MLHLSQDLKEKSDKATILLDTNVFMYASRHTELLDLVKELTIRDCAFITTTSVVFEYTRGSRTLAELTARREFIKGIVQRVMSIGNFFENDKNDVFSAVMSLLLKSGDSQYTDFLLAVALYQYRLLPESIYILSSDAKAYPLKMFNIEGVVTIEDEGINVRHLYLIALDKTKYASIASSVDSTSQID